MEDNPVIEKGKLCATCSAACPVHTDTREYTQRIARGDYEGALDVLLEVNPFPSVCGRICHHPCEAECRRGAIDAPVSLRMLKRFVTENTLEYRKSRKAIIGESKGKKVAVIGGGPSGLTAARDLALIGYEVTVFEKDTILGGMLAHAIPKYRLPLDALKEDIDDILSLGIEMKTGVDVGKDVTFEQLRKDCDAVLLAVGLSESHSLPIPNMDADGVLLGIPFLWDTANGHAPALGRRVLIIGGGNVAVDAARAARRLGPEKVYMACLESRAEMPAWSWEIEEAEDEGIEILNSWGPKAIIAKDGKCTGIEFKKCTRVFDENKRFSPEYDESATTIVEVDNVIATIGQKANLDCVGGASDVAVDRGRLICSRSNMATSAPGVFACGEVMTGPGSAIAAVGTGHDAAKVIDHWLTTGETLELPSRDVETIGNLPADTAARARKLDRIEVALMDPAQRIKDFTVIEPGYTEEQALAEARRCLACATGAELFGLCAGCLTCVRICPFGVARVDRTASMPASECQTCGLCAAVCPAAGIALARFATNKMKEVLAETLANADRSKIAKPFVVAYCCMNETKSRKYLVPQTPEDIAKTGVLRVPVPCVGRLGTLDLIAPFELGADRVAVIACKEDDGCMYPDADELTARRIKRTQSFLDDIGVGGNNLRFYHTTGSAEESWAALFEEAKKALEAPVAGSK